MMANRVIVRILPTLLELERTSRIGDLEVLVVSGDLIHLGNGTGLGAFLQCCLSTRVSARNVVGRTRRRANRKYFKFAVTQMVEAQR